MLVQANYAFVGLYEEYNYLFIPILAILFFEHKWFHVVSYLCAIGLYYIPNYLNTLYPDPYFGSINAISIFAMVSAIVWYLKRANMQSEQALATRQQVAINLVEQRLLCAQLNPHFVFNTLETIQAKILVSQPKEAALRLAKFGTIMRKTLEHTRQDYIAVHEEMSVLYQYMDYYRSMLNHAFDFEVSCTSGLSPKAWAIPPMFVQPFVENAITHGMGSQKQGKISIHFTKVGQTIHVRVIDNGVGLGRAVKRQGHHSLSSTITQERLQRLSVETNANYQQVVTNIQSHSGDVVGVQVDLYLPCKAISPTQ